MKFKRTIAALLGALQLFGAGSVFAEEAVADDAAATEQAVEVSDAVADSGEEVEIPLEENEVRVFVSQDGKDTASGSFTDPVKTIEKGIALGTQLKNSNPGKTVTVNIRGGDYYINRTISLTMQNNGTAQNPFVIQSYNGEEVNIKGSTQLSKRFSQLKDEEVLSRIPEAARKYIGVYDLPSSIASASGYVTVVDTGSSTMGNTQLFVDGVAQTIARWPNSGYDRVSSVVSTESFIGTDAKARISRWKNATSAVACGYFQSEYTFTSKYITSIDGNTINLESKPYYGIAMDKRFYVENLLEELDSPGEYFIDSAAGKLYFYPQHNMLNSVVEMATMTETMFKGTGLAYITFKGLTIGDTRGHAVEFTNSSNITFDGCTIRNVGWKGLVLSKCNNMTIVNNTIHGIGSNAIAIEGGDRAKLQSSNNLIDNNHIYDFAQTAKTNNPGIDLDGVGCTITNNCFHGSVSQAILYTGNDHIIKYNEFYDLTNECSDAGAIYTGRNYTYRGNEIAYNYFHDIHTTADKGGSIWVAGVYLDDMASSANVHHNVFYNCHLGVMIGGGRDNQFDNNILVDCDTAMFMDARGVGWANYHVVAGGQAYNTIFTVPYSQEPWVSRFPELAAVAENIDTLGRPDNNSICNNIMLDCLMNVIAPEMKTYGKVENNYEKKGVEADKSIFVDYANQNFAIKDGASILKTHPGLAEIDMSKIGLRADKSAEEKEKAEAKQFRAISPWNGTTGVSNLGAEFTWQKHDNATKYIVKVAEDPAMENVVVTKESKANNAIVEFIPSGGKPYWWTVTAVSDTQSLKGTYEQTGAPKLLISIETEQRDKTELRENLAVLRKLSSTMKEGDEPGTYKKGFKSKVDMLLQEAEAASASLDIMQKDIQNINDRYDELIDSIRENINYTTVNVGDMLKNQGAWIYEDECYKFNSDGSLSLIGPSGKKINHYKFMIYDEPLGDNVAIKFGYNVHVASNYCMIGLQNDATLFKGGYEIIIKSNQLEVQKYVTGTTGSPIKSTALNFYISDDKWVDLEFGALKTGIGTYVYLLADGVTVAEFFDMDDPIWSGDSKFVFGNPSTNEEDGVAHIRAAQE